MEAAETVGVSIQGDEDSTPEPQAEELPVDVVATIGTILLCISGCLNGFSVIFQIDRGAGKCFVGRDLRSFSLQPRRMLLNKDVLKTSKTFKMEIFANVINGFKLHIRCLTCF